jgi:hypothetical protein
MIPDKIILMNPTRKTSTTLAKTVLSLALAFLTVFLISGLAASSGTQAGEERELEDTIPKHLPLKAKIRKEKEKAFKDLKNEKWLRDFELEVTNTGDKPIYLLHLLLTLPEIIAPDGNKVGFLLHYGRSQLGNVETKAAPDDIPIKPGETHVFRLPDVKVISWERFKQREGRPDPKKLILKFQILSFGDGTGFVGNNGMAVPRTDVMSGPDRCKPDPSLSHPSDTPSQRASKRRWPGTFPPDDLPAELLLANFLSAEFAHPVSLKLNPQSQDCCSGNGCLRYKPTTSP